MKSPYQSHTANGFTWAYDEGGAHFFSKKNDTGYLLMRCLPDDMTNGNFTYFAEHGLTNTNKVPLAQRAAAMLTADQKRAIEAFAARHGRYWKNLLRVAWISGRDEKETDGALLRQIRNELGPTWLKGYQP